MTDLYSAWDQEQLDSKLYRDRHNNPVTERVRDYSRTTWMLIAYSILSKDEVENRAVVSWE